MNEGITIHNDGKGGHMSFEARCLEVIDDSGYGETQEEAIDELKEKVYEKITKLKDIDYTKITDVAWDNTPTEEYLKKFHKKYG